MVSLISSLITALLIDCNKYIIKEIEIYPTVAVINQISMIYYTSASLLFSLITALLIDCNKHIIKRLPILIVTETMHHYIIKI